MTQIRFSANVLLNVHIYEVKHVSECTFISGVPDIKALINRVVRGDTASTISAGYPDTTDRTFELSHNFN